MRTFQFVALMTALVVAPPLCTAQSANDSSSAVVDVYLNAVRTVVVPGASDAIVLDPDIAQLDCLGDQLRFTGLQRGETLAIAHVDGKALSLIVRVVLRPVLTVAPTMGGPQLEHGIGTLGSDVQISHFGESTSAVLLDSVFWRQKIGDRQFAMSMSAEHATLPGQYGFNLRTGNIDYRTSRLELNLLDQNVNLSGADVTDHVPTFSLSDNLQIRGVSVSFSRGRNQVSIFGGATIPYYFLSLASSRDVTGVSFRRKLSERWSIFTATSALSIPNQVGSARNSSFMQQGGFRFVASRRLSFEGTGGISNSGEMFRGDASYNGSRFNAFVSALHSSPLYPLNQVQSLFAGTSSVRTGITTQWDRRIAGSFYYEHASVSSGLLHLAPATSDYFSPALTLTFTQRQSATFSFTRSFSRGGFQQARQSGSRLDAAWRSLLPHGVMNTAQIQSGSIQDPLQTNSANQLTVADTLSFHVRSASLQLSFSHNRTNPSLVQKLNQELSLLSPQLQQVFLQDPVTFVSSELPPEIRSLLDSRQPVSTAAGIAAQVPLTRKLSVNPNFSLNRNTLGTLQQNWTGFFGYNLTYELSRSLQLRSSLNSVWMADATRTSLQRTTVFSAGVLKSFSGSPMRLLSRRSRRIIQGRVFRDDNINGAFNKGEPGIAGVQVQLDGSMETAVTDEQGIYRFPDVHGGVHRVSINLAQFSDPVRMTTRGETAIDLDSAGVAPPDFGIINFARLMGFVFNDLRMQGAPQADSPGLGNLRLLLRKGERTVATIVVPPNGHFEEDNIVPGDYDLIVDADTVPANYSAGADSVPIHIAPVSTVETNLPLRAMRSIAGHVFLKVPINGKDHAKEESEKFTLLPLVGVRLAAGGAVATTGDGGAFVLRNLPAGDLSVTFVPLKVVPEDLKLPTGKVQMPAEPIEIEGSKIVLSNPELVPYLVPAENRK